jgi:hypothetical protein
LEKLLTIASPRQLALPFGILTIIVLMVVPIPAFMLDVFFVFNIALSVAVLMASMNAEKPLDFSSFPTVLLFATLLRLALNVASTRVVLVHGHEGPEAAGHVIEAFGEFLIGGNFAVGLFVFMILMIINMVVITKGAGRVSEVSARFTLDAMPGKQMAIDADLAGGLITADDARARRREITTEADFYGSMDGASKFEGRRDCGPADPWRQYHRRILPWHDHPRPFGQRCGEPLYQSVDRRRSGGAGARAVAVHRRRRDRDARHRQPRPCRANRRAICRFPHMVAGGGHPGCDWRDTGHAPDGVPARCGHRLFHLEKAARARGQRQNRGRHTRARRRRRPHPHRVGGCIRSHAGYGRIGLWAGATG